MKLVIIRSRAVNEDARYPFVGTSTRKKFFEFFTVPIRNAHTRAAYYRAIQQFLS